LRRVEGYVIVSADGMLADAMHEMPASLRNDADQQFFQAALDQAAVVVHGRHSHEGGPRAARRRRLVLTRQIAAVAPDPSHPNSLLWNPAGAPLEQALATLGSEDGTIAVIGGPDVFDLFLPLFDAFHLSRAANVMLTDGCPVFTGAGPPATPEDILAAHGLKPGPRRVLDAAAGVSVVTWAR
jgi:dihydrofolate reductase